ncbi:MAG: GNAT family N-acetyltransferase [Solirubrobacterales bacterium]|nr:GNAT family N-acetyltransferase [Solirubrobacterales bacterium]MCB8915668.1 GNAT family N-acetyltransferase [Thermoleophilales bacterium]
MIEIRPVTAEEFPRFEPLFISYQEFYEVEEIDPDRNREFFSRFVVREDGSATADGWLLGAFDGDEIIGFGCFYRHKSSLSATDVVLMNDLYVSEAARGKGAGRALIEAGVGLARESGASHLTWATAPDNHRAQALYDSFDVEKGTWLEYEIKV